MFELVVCNARVVTAEQVVEADIGITGEQIAAIGTGLSGRSVIDAEGRYVTPGGIDAHCHLAQRSHSGAEAADDFTSGTRSALFGGTTTVIPFAPQTESDGLRAGVHRYLEQAEDRAFADYSAHAIVSHIDQAVLSDVARLVDDGLPSFKAYTTYDKLKLAAPDVIRLMEAVAAAGGVLLVHAEDDDLVRWRTENLIRIGATALKDHARARDRLAEVSAIQQICCYARAVGAEVVIVHVSTGEGLDVIAAARRRGASVTPEICTHHLLLDDTVYSGAGFGDARYVYTPPPRPRADVEALWHELPGLADVILSSDHVSYRLNDPTGKLRAGANAPFHKVPNGTPGIELRLPILMDQAVNGGKLSACQLVKAAATRPARTYGLFPRKGTIAPGADADLVIWSTDQPKRISQSLLHDNMDFTPYEGLEISCWPQIVILRGRVAIRDGKLDIPAGYGRLQHRAAGPR